MRRFSFKLMGNLFRNSEVYLYLHYNFFPFLTEFDLIGNAFSLPFFLVKVSLLRPSLHLGAKLDHWVWKQFELFLDKFLLLLWSLGGSILEEFPISSKSLFALPIVALGTCDFNTTL